MNENTKTAFIEAVREHRSSMYRTAWAILRRSADAEDAVSCAVEATWRHLGQLKNLDALKAYLMRCTVNAAKRELFRRRRVSSMEETDETVAEPERASPIEEMIASLGEKYRLPLLLKFSEGYNESEIAVILHLPRGTVSSRISRALKMLRDEFEREA